jgi:hypothetical protein
MTSDRVLIVVILGVKSENDILKNLENILRIEHGPEWA